MKEKNGINAFILVKALPVEELFMVHGYTSSFFAKGNKFRDFLFVLLADIALPN